MAWRPERLGWVQIASLRRGWRDERGVAALEFVLYLPLMVLVMIGGVATYDSVRQGSRSLQAASIAADLASRVEKLSKTEIGAIFAASAALVGSDPNDANFSVTISSVVNRSNNPGRGCSASAPAPDTCLQISWSETHNGSKLASLTDLDLPVIPAGESVVVAQLVYDYELFTDILQSARVNYTRTAYRRPRFAREILFTP